MIVPTIPAMVLLTSLLLTLIGLLCLTVWVTDSPTREIRAQRYNAFITFGCFAAIWDLGWMIAAITHSIVTQQP